MLRLLQQYKLTQKLRQNLGTTISSCGNPLHRTGWFVAGVSKLFVGRRMAVLRRPAGRKEQLQSLRFHRLIDNETITLTAKEMWTTLNYHLIHWMDFLPVANWSENVGSLQQFGSLYGLLKDAGELQVNIDLDLSDVEGFSLHDIVHGEGAVFEQGRISSQRFTAERSGKIGHSLGFVLEWAPAAKL